MLADIETAPTLSLAPGVLSRADRLADRVAEIGGSWSFILGFGAFLLAWVLLNCWLLGRLSFDPYPFIFLNLVLSMLAAVQAPIIMMSQNRHAELDRARALLDHALALEAQREIRSLHRKLDALRAEVAARDGGAEAGQAD